MAAAAAVALRLRRSLSLLSPLCALSTTTTTVTVTARSLVHSSPQNPNCSQFAVLRFRNLHSSPRSLAMRRNDYEGEKLDPNEILFEGCDYEHWLITVDFPKPFPPPVEMVETYVQIAAKVVGSVEEAKKRIYACSTTTYQGFQILVDEETSKKFEDVPGVVFVLPDSYIDPINKEYGGDKYINGTIIPRPPPVQYGRQPRRPNRGPNQPYQGNQGHDQQRWQGGPSGDARNQTYDQQRFGQGDGRNQPYDQQRFCQGDRRNQPYDQQRFGQGDGKNYAPQQSYPSQQNPSGYGPVDGERNSYRSNNFNLGDTNRANHYPQQQDRYPAAGQRDHGFQGQGAYRDNTFQRQEGGYPGQTQNFSPPPFQGGASGQGGFRPYGQHGDGSHGQGSSDINGQAERSFNQNNVHGEQRNYAPMGGETGIKQGGY
ncbi:hypothetical protein Droror1_Dr00027393 [Drosera rotundifolia]